MIEELKSTDLVNKVGGRFKLSALIQKRIVEIMQGSRPLIDDTEGMTNLEIVVKEIKEDPDLVRTAPHNTPVSRLDEVKAAKQPTWKTECRRVAARASGTWHPVPTPGSAAG